MIKFFIILILCSLVSVVHSSELVWKEYGFQGGGGTFRSTSTLTQDVSKSGSTAWVEGNAALQLSRKSILELGLGTQLNWVSGTNSQFEQSITQNSLLLGLSYRYQFLKWLEAGVLLRNQMGKGAYFDLTQLDSYQMNLSVGPEVLFRFPMDKYSWIAGVSIQRDLFVPNQTQTQIPIFIGIRCHPWGQKLSDVSPSSDRTEFDSIPGSIAHKSGESQVRVILPLSRTGFEVLLAKFLSENADLWGQVEIKANSSSVELKKMQDLMMEAIHPDMVKSGQVKAVTNQDSSFVEIIISQIKDPYLLAKTINIADIDFKVWKVHEPSFEVEEEDSDEHE